MKILKSSIAIFLLLITFDCKAIVSNIINKDLYDACETALKFLKDEDKRTNFFKIGRCLGYIEGANDMHFQIAAFLSNFSVTEVDKKSLYCIPDNVSGTELAKVYVKFIDEHPNMLHEPAIVGLTKAFSYYYPCKKNQD